MGELPCELKSLFGYNWNCCNLFSSGVRFASISGTWFVYCGFLNCCWLTCCRRTGLCLVCDTGKGWVGDNTWFTCSSVSMGVCSGDGICRFVRSGREPPVLAAAIGKLGPVCDMCSADGYILSINITKWNNFNHDAHVKWYRSGLNWNLRPRYSFKLVTRIFQ